MNGEEVVEPQEDVVEGSKRCGNNNNQSQRALYKLTKDATTLPPDTGIFDMLPFYIVRYDTTDVKQ